MPVYFGYAAYANADLGESNSRTYDAVPARFRINQPMTTLRSDLSAGQNGKKGNRSTGERGNSVGKLRKAGLAGRPRIPVLRGLGATLALAAGLAPAALASPSPAPRPGTTAGSGPDDGVVGNAPYCARDYERLDGDLYIAYNDGSGDYTCLQTTDQQKSTGFRVTTFKQDIPGGVGAFPNVFGGFEWGRHPKNSFLPPEESKDGNPPSTVSVKTVPGGFYNAAYDIWFNKTDPYDHRDPRQRHASAATVSGVLGSSTVAPRPSRPMTARTIMAIP